MKEIKGPEFLRYCSPIIEVLREIGGSGTASEVTDLVIEKLAIPIEEQQEMIKSGASRVKNRIAWARFYLSKAGFLDSSQRGVWNLTGKGIKSEMTEEVVLDLFKDVQRNFARLPTKKRETKNKPIAFNENDEEMLEYVDHKTRLLNILKELPPGGFERICQRLLRESGFQQVVVTGRSSDGGIDGHGILQVNPFVTFSVLFQCKRYQGAVTPSQVRDFRGAMMGRTDKGIIITTGVFTTEATKEARRDGVPPIELVDGEKLIEMFELLEMGLKPVKVYDVDQRFFDEFKT